MKCWNLTFNAWGLRVIIIPTCTSKSSENICSNSGGAQEKGKTMKTHSTTKTSGKTSLGPHYFTL
jgi:hypothetical protein